MNDILSLVNTHIRLLTPYSSARDDFKGDADVYLDANESWFDGVEKANRYPDPEAVEVRKALEKVLSLPFEKTVIGNGSDEIIDLLIRIFCKSGEDSIMIMRPTYGAYKVFADINNVRTLNVLLKEDLSLDMETVLDVIREENPKIVFICTPNNPTGKVYSMKDISLIAKVNKGITVVDEAYADFDPDFVSAVSLIDKYPRLCVMRTLSKAWGIAGARFGILVANPVIRDIVSKVKPPYNVSVLDQRAALEALSKYDEIMRVRNQVIADRKMLEKKLLEYDFVRNVIPTKANFIVVEVLDADKLYSFLMSHGVIVRNRKNEPRLKEALRITVGSESENRRLLEVLDEFGRA